MNNNFYFTSKDDIALIRLIRRLWDLMNDATIEQFLLAEDKKTSYEEPKPMSSISSQ
jgi:hypothetical protein